jgi:CBS domain-containing protein
VAFQLNLRTETVDHAYPVAPLCVDPQMSVREVFHLLKKEQRGSLLVCQGDALVGIFTERDALQLMADDADLDVPLEQVMTLNPVTISVTDTVQTAIREMSQGGLRRLPIVDDDHRPVGTLKVSKILRYLVEHFPKYIYNLPPTPHHVTQQREGA